MALCVLSQLFARSLVLLADEGICYGREISTQGFELLAFLTEKIDPDHIKALMQVVLHAPLMIVFHTSKPKDAICGM